MLLDHLSGKPVLRIVHYLEKVGSFVADDVEFNLLNLLFLSKQFLKRQGPVSVYMYALLSVYLQLLKELTFSCQGKKHQPRQAGCGIRNPIWK